MLLLGHIHIYEIMIREILPTFLDLIEDGRGFKNGESQLNKYQESMLRVDSKGKLEWK